MYTAVQANLDSSFPSNLFKLNIGNIYQGLRFVPSITRGFRQKGHLNSYVIVPIDSSKIPGFLLPVYTKDLCWDKKKRWDLSKGEDQISRKMYVTRPHSLYKNSPASLYLPPPEGPNSGYLVLQDEDPTPPFCFNLYNKSRILDFPFPQNKLLQVHHQLGNRDRLHSVYFIPVINQPLSSYQFYAIKPHGRHSGEAYTSSKKEEEIACCFGCNDIQDVEPRPLDPNDVYQQFEVSAFTGCMSDNRFSAKSMAPDASLPLIFKRKGWLVTAKKPQEFSLSEAEGLNSSLCGNLPDLNFPVLCEASEPVVVGKWYSPFMFIKDMAITDQVKGSMFYEVILERRWERICMCQNWKRLGKKTVIVDIQVPTEVVQVAGKEAVEDRRCDDNGFVWFLSTSGKGDVLQYVGLSSLIIERMVWEVERAGWVKGKENHARVMRTEAYEGEDTWSRFGCYVLVDSFVVKRMDGSKLLTYEFKHAHQNKSKWE